LASAVTTTAAKIEKTAPPAFKQYREPDGLFYFKLVDAQGQVLLQSRGFEAPKEAGQAIARLQNEGITALETLADKLLGVSTGQSNLIAQALSDLREIAESKKK
jgi:tryptophanyl-tRNA synthetase